MRSVHLIALRELTETLRDGRVFMMWVVPVIACSLLQWMLLQTPIFSSPIPAPGEPLYMSYEGPSWLQDGLESEFLSLSQPDNLEEANGHLRVVDKGPTIKLQAELYAHNTELEHLLLERALREKQSELSDVIGQWYSIDGNIPWDVHGTEDKQELNLSEGWQTFATKLGPLLWLPLIALHFNNMVMPAVEMTDEVTRGTEETTRMMPCLPSHVLAGKVFAVATLGLLATSGQCFAILLTLGHSMTIVLQSIPQTLLDAASITIVWPSLPSPWVFVLACLFWVPTTFAHATILTLGANTPSNRTGKELATLGTASVLIVGSLASTSLPQHLVVWLPLVNVPSVLSACFDPTVSGFTIVAASLLNGLVGIVGLLWFNRVTMVHRP